MTQRQDASEPPQRKIAWLGPVLVWGIAALVLLSQLGATGLWTLGELPVLDRTLAALGEPRSELTRSPWLPDQLRTFVYAASGRVDAGLRLPGALAGLGLVALALVSARRLGWSSAWVALAGCFALAMPGLLASSRTVLGNPTGELWLSAASLCLIASCDRARRGAERGSGLGWRIAFGLLGLSCLVAAVASLGVVLGGCLPLVLVALADVARDPEHGGIELPRWAVISAWTGAAVAGFFGLWLAWNQGEGYIPLLGAAKDLSLIENPSKAGFTDALESFGYQAFPFTGLVVLGLLGPGRARWPALWLGVALVVVSVWTLTYGPTPTPVTIPAALLATAACKRMFDSDEPIAARRLLVFGAILGALVLGKDAGRTPARIASPLLQLTEIEFPQPGVVPGFDLVASLPRMSKQFAGLLLLAHLLAPRSTDQREWAWAPVWVASKLSTLMTIADRLVTRARVGGSGLHRLRTAAPLVLLFAALTHQIWAFGVVTLTQVNQQMSIAAPLRGFIAGVEAGQIPDPMLGLHRIRDPGLDYYGPGTEHEVFLSNRSDLDKWLGVEAPRTALIRRTDLPPIFSAARSGDRPLFVLDNSHHAYVLVANFLPPGHEDQNPLLGIAFSEPLTLANETLVGWQPYVDLIAWEIEGELHRGSKATLHAVFRVQRPMPAGTQMYARLQKGKVSRVAAEPHELTGGALPPNYWRAGDYIHHRFEFKVPWLEVLPGEHELIVGLRRSEKSNLKISVPEGKRGEHGVEVRGKSHEFAKIGVVELAW
ncbi:hypothetical protein DB30_05834 [Enhygromyxa salina]|uniref:Uncharacterized protein n=1 Tax=Enhygromyxa salina TaxID=215803 RepID=A0A0C1ZBN4_9BACT|nr:hypothetical protein [Enhygromyxa salina]KIG15134.1 hypothetical protein DB30_05834 [Enhygromyxa salina]